MNLVNLIKKAVGVSKKKTRSVNSPKSNEKELRTKQFNFLLTPTLYNKLIKASEKLGKSKSAIVNCAIAEFLEKI